MKFPNKCKIEAIASTERGREAIAEAYLTGDKLVATNGLAIVVLPVERDPQDSDGWISHKALAGARKQAKRNKAEVIANGCLKLADGTQLPRPDMQDMKFPNWEQVIPKNTAETHKTVIRINAAILADMAAAMGTDCVTLHIKDELSPLMVYPATPAPGNFVRPDETAMDAKGVLMPIRRS